MKITIHGKPIAKARPRFFRRGKFVGTYNAQETEEGRFMLEAHQQIGEPMEGPVSVECIFHIQRPKGHHGTGKNAGTLKASAPEYHTIKPDVDNYLKFVLDCLNGLAWKDDGQVVEVWGWKVYGIPKTEIEVRAHE